MNNAEIADLLHEFADIMDLKGDVFKRNAYRRAAQNVQELDGDVLSYYREGRLESIPGVGKSIAQKIAEIIRTGRSAELEALRAQYPPGLVELTQVPDLGPKKAHRLYRELGIRDLAGLKKASLEHRIRRLEGFGRRSEEKILQGIELVERNSGRMLLGDALPIGLAVESYLRENGIEHVSVAGSLRRRKETIGDIDIVVGSDLPLEATRLFVSYPRRETVVLQGPTRSSIRLDDGTQVDLRVVPVSDYGATLLYFTGSKEHTVELRRMAMQMGYRLNEYGLFRRDDGSVVAREEERDIYRALGLDLIPPEMREMRGEIEAAGVGRLPDLLRSEDIRGDLHVHTVMSDGHATMRELAREAKRLGYEYIGLTDHSPSLRIAHGPTAGDLLDSVEEARQVSEEEGSGSARSEGHSRGRVAGLPRGGPVLAGLRHRLRSLRFQMRGGDDGAGPPGHERSEVNVLGHPTGGSWEQGGLQNRPGAGDGARLPAVWPWSLTDLRTGDLNDLNCRRAKERGQALRRH